MLDFEFIFYYESYLSEYLMAIKHTNNGKYDMVTNKNPKLPFYSFHDCLNSTTSEAHNHIWRWTQSAQVPGKDWSNFLDRLFEIYEREYFKLVNEVTEFDTAGNEVVYNTMMYIYIYIYIYILYMCIYICTVL